MGFNDYPLDGEIEIEKNCKTKPALIEDVKPLITYLKKLSQPEIAKKMSVNGSIATTVYEYYKIYDTEEALRRLAIYGFRGMAYQKLDVLSLNTAAIEYLCDRLIICDPFYGILKGSDEIQPYRLELAAPLTHKGNEWVVTQDGSKITIQDHWSEKPTEALKSHIKNKFPDEQPVLINIASEEYYHQINSEALKGEGFKILKCYFFIGDRSAPSVILKHARGLIARYGSMNLCETVEDLKGFDLEGWKFKSLIEDSLVFHRSTTWKKPVPKAKAAAKPKGGLAKKVK